MGVESLRIDLILFTETTDGLCVTSPLNVA